MVFKQFFLNTLMARETPPPPLHGKCLFKFPFWFLEPFPKAVLTKRLRRSWQNVCWPKIWLIAHPYPVPASISALAQGRWLTWSWAWRTLVWSLARCPWSRIVLSKTYIYTAYILYISNCCIWVHFVASWSKSLQLIRNHCGFSCPLVIKLSLHHHL